MAKPFLFFEDQLNKLENEKTEKKQTASDEDVRSIAKRLIAKNKQAYEMLAK